MADRRKREIGQIWRSPFSQSSDSGRIYISHGEYIITDLYRANGRNYARLYSHSRHTSYDVPRSMISTSEDRRWEYLGTTSVPELRATVIRCNRCGAGDVKLYAGNRLRFSQCRFCGR
jgi:hypothetical protein